jgi:hypothetical protein
MKKKILLYCFIASLFLGLILPSIWPLFRSDFFRMHDYTHVARLVEMDKAIRDGHWPPRWAEDLGWGYGMPLFNFYAPLPYYLGEIFHLLGFSFLNSIKLVFGLSFFIAFGGMFLLARKFWGKLGGFLAGLAFVYSPYRAVDFYVRGALGELFAISLIPWVIWGTTVLIDGKRKKFISLTSFFLALLLLSHTVLDFICLPLLIVFALIYFLINKKPRVNLLNLILSFVLGLGLASFFWLPAFWEKDFTRVGELIGGYSHYSHHFLYFRQFLNGQWGYGGSVDGPNDGLSFHLGRVHLLLSLLTFIFSYFYSCLKKRFEKRELLVAAFLLLIIFLAFLSTYHAKLIWDAIPLMAFVQFPWRLNSFIIVLVAFLTGGGCFYLKKFVGQKASLVFLIFFILLLLKTNLNYFKPQTYINPNDFYYSEEERIKERISGVIPDYIPQAVGKEPEEIAREDYLVIEGNPEIEVIESKTQSIVLKIDGQDDSRIQLNRFYFPGWQLFIDGQKSDFEYKDNNGIIKTNIPEGEHNLKLVFKPTLARRLGEMISFISGLLILWKLLI